MKILTKLLILLTLLIPNLSFAMEFNSSDDEELSSSARKNIPAKKQKTSLVKSKNVVNSSSDEDKSLSDESTGMPDFSAKTHKSCPHCSHLREECLTARTHGAGASGKWLDKVTPKRGWYCTGAEDLGDGNLEQCEMCEREQVRYIHRMTHGNAQLSVGCICSGHMEGRFEDKISIDNAVAAAQKRVTTLQNRTARRLSFPDLPNWKVSKKGNTYIKKDGHHIIMSQGKYGGYSAIVDGHKLDKWLDTMKLAKLAAFDYLYPSIVQ